MSKYMFLFRGGSDMQQASPADQQANMMKWKVWMDDIAAKGKLHGGEPLSYGAGKVLSGRTMKMTDGPFAEGKEIVGGYLIVDAKDINEAAELGKGCPIFENDGSVEVRVVMEM
ncbi:MAG: hypothetical protein IPG74_12855 [Flavobacteriales bacterium]|nr:hypothetical protein [Flavobacteriales bacterium]MBK7554144.1 hypothetical protein [Flavobacteriales bacterium]MBK9196627.1 hypothetical protein [Flavobacteriales bacterium]MBP6574757.1 hypothetical protein [Flavobacteriales bacterium]